MGRQFRDPDPNASDDTDDEVYDKPSTSTEDIGRSSARSRRRRSSVASRRRKMRKQDADTASQQESEKTAPADSVKSTGPDPDESDDEVSDKPSSTTGDSTGSRSRSRRRSAAGGQGRASVASARPGTKNQKTEKAAATPPVDSATPTSVGRIYNYVRQYFIREQNTAAALATADPAAATGCCRQTMETSASS